MANHATSPWYALGRALGSAGLLTARPSNPRRRAEDPVAGLGGGGTGLGAPLPPALAGPLAGAAGSALLSGLERWAGRRRPSFSRLVRGAVAGAGAAGILMSLRALLDGDGEADFVDELLAGAGKGVIYASLVDPLLPGPPLFRGAAVGTIDYLFSPTGGIYSRLQALSPARKIPVVSILLEAGDAEEDPYVAFLCYGVALGLLYGDVED